MRAHLLLALFASTILACSSSDSSGSTTDTGTGNPCEGLGCTSMPGILVVKVHDASGADVPSPTFTEKGAKLAASCASPTDAGPDVCPAGWTFPNLFEGPHTIVVTAPGFDTQTITVTIQGPAGCCGIGPEVDQTVTLTPINAGDSGTDASEAG
jgi:hypothetical protein